MILYVFLEGWLFGPRIPEYRLVIVDNPSPAPTCPSPNSGKAERNSYQQLNHPNGIGTQKYASQSQNPDNEGVVPHKIGKTLLRDQYRPPK